MISDIEKKYGPCTIRRPSKKAENQYTLIKTETGKFYALFGEGKNTDRDAQISEAVYMELLRQAREDDAELRRKRRYQDDSCDVLELTDRNVSDSVRSVEDAVIEKVLLSNAVDALGFLSDLQRRRLHLYFCQGLTLDDIAALEGCTKMAVSYSLRYAIKALKKIFGF